MGEFFTWATLGSMAGATSAVTLITQFIKWLCGGKLAGWATRAVSFVAALVVLYLSAFFTGPMDAATVAITALNAIVVTLAANGLFDNIKSVVSTQKKKKTVRKSAKR